MMDALFEFGFSNLIVASALALIACVVQATGKHQNITHLLWLLVIAKLVTPPIVSAPVVVMPDLLVTSPAVSLELPASAESMQSFSGAQSEEASERQSTAIFPTALLSMFSVHSNGFIRVVGFVWLVGSGLLAAWSLMRIVQFHRLMNRASEEGSTELQGAAQRIAKSLGLASAPQVLTTRAHLSPMTWWSGGRVKVILSDALLENLTADQLDHVLAHELAHVRRNDHVVRWVEWLACVCCWWNPLAWYASRKLRVSEEICCDALALSRLDFKPLPYAGSLLVVAEFLKSAPTHSPPLASNLNGAGTLQRRFKMIVAGNLPSQTSVLVRGLILVCAVVLLPLGVAHSQQATQDNASSQELRELVESGEVSVEEARLLFDALDPVDWVQQRYAAGVAEIDAAVEAGRATAEAGLERKDALAATLQGTAFYMEVFGLSAGEAQKKIAAEAGNSLRKSKVASRGRDAASLDWMYEHMANAGIPRERLAEVMGAVKKVMPMMKLKGADFQLDPRMHAYLTSLDLTNEQIQLVLGLSTRAAARLSAASAPEPSEVDGIKGYYARMGFGDADYEEMLAHLGEQGFDPQLNDQLMGALLRLGMGMKRKRPCLRHRSKDESVPGLSQRDGGTGQVAEGLRQEALEKDGEGVRRSAGAGRDQRRRRCSARLFCAAQHRRRKIRGTFQEARGTRPQEGAGSRCVARADPGHSRDALGRCCIPTRRQHDRLLQLARVVECPG